MALDVGKKIIGVAIGDPEGRMAMGRPAIVRRGLRQDLDAIAAVARDEEVETVVVGLPRSLDGTVGAQGERVRRFGEQVRERLGLPVEYWDERLTTVAAERALREAGLSPSERRARIDTAAATIILQSYLDYRRGGVSRADVD